MRSLIIIPRISDEALHSLEFPQTGLNEIFGEYFPNSSGLLIIFLASQQSRITGTIRVLSIIFMNYRLADAYRIILRCRES